MMDNLGATVLVSWNCLYLDLYSNNRANKLQVLKVTGYRRIL